jgi:short-subunit dehydrogenase
MHVVVTGASSGIGVDLARIFATPGNKLSLVARRKELLEQLKQELGVPATVITADLTRVEDPVAWLREAEAAHGPVDMLINNAGVSYLEPVLGIDPERLRAMFQINAHTPIAAIHHVLPGMLERRSGTIVNVTSVAAFTYAPYLCHYHASKGALGNFSESLRIEIAKSGVNVVTVYPGPIDTPMAERNWAQLKESRAAKSAPRGNTRTLARLVHDAVDRREARVIYPGFYRVGWLFPWLARFVSERFIPEATGAKTPLMGGDLLK